MSLPETVGLKFLQLIKTIDSKSIVGIKECLERRGFENMLRK